MASMNQIHETVSYLRKHQTECERVFWRLVRNRGLEGYKFSRQVPFYFRHDGRTRFVVVDFYCAERKLAVEIDGGIHDKKTEMDAYRSMILDRMGVRVLRVRNEEMEDLDGVREKVLAALRIGPLTPRPPL